MDIKEKAKELAAAIVETPEYQRLKQARAQIEQHHAAKVMLKDFHKKQLDLQKQHLEGTPVTDSQIEELTKLYEILNINPYIRELFQAELAFQKLMMDIQEILGDAIDLEPLDELEDEEEEKPAEDAILKATKKLWVPGN